MMGTQENWGLLSKSSMNNSKLFHRIPLLTGTTVACNLPSQKLTQWQFHSTQVTPLCDQYLEDCKLWENRNPNCFVYVHPQAEHSQWALKQHLIFIIEMGTGNNNDFLLCAKISFQAIETY